MEKRFKYDFFISYKHGNLDSIIAGYIQKKLERYKIPREIQKKSGKKKITRVFRDKEELSVTANLTQEIEEQLKNTEYLIVICSPESRQSVWVNREVETFIQYRGMEYVLPVLIKGEPEDSFLDVIAGEEVLAADVRGKDLRESKKKCRNELLRLIAPTLSCSYDELKQRHRNYTFQRIAVAAVGVAIVGTGFATYSFRQAKRIDEEYQNARKNQARYLSEISGELLDSGDRMGALKTALAILPEGDSDEALVPEQEGALNNALYSYTDNDLLKFWADHAEKTEGSFAGSLNTILEGDFDDEGNYYVTVDNKGIAYFYSGDKGECLWKLDPAQITGEIGEKIYVYDIIDENRTAFRLNKEIWVVDYKKKEIIKKIPLSGKCQGSTNDCLVVDGEFLALSEFESHHIVIYNLETGREEDLVLYKKFGIKHTIIDGVNTMIWNSKTRELILGVSCGYDNDNIGLIYYSFKTDKYKILSEAGTEQIALLDDTYLAAVQYTDYEGKELNFYSKSTYQLCIYNIVTGEIVWKEDGFKGNGKWERAGCMVYEIKNKKRVLVFYLQNMVYILDADTRKLITKGECEAQIAGIEQCSEEKMLIGLEDGSIYIGAFDDMNIYLSKANASLYYVGGVTGEIARFYYNSKTKMAVQLCYDIEQIVFLKRLKDENSQTLVTDRGVNNIYYFTVEQGREKKTYRCIKYRDISSKEKEKIVIYEAGTSKVKYESEAEKAGIMFDHIKIGMQGNKLVLCYIKNYSSIVLDDYEKEKAELHIINLESGKEERNYTFETYYISEESVFYASDLSKMFIQEHNGISQIDLTPVVTKNKLACGEGDSICNIYLTADDKYLIITRVDYNKSSLEDSDYYYLQVWDLEKKEWKELDGKQKYEGIMAYKSITVGKKKATIAVQKKDGRIEFWDIESSSKINTITLSDKIQSVYTYSYSFFDNDEYYIIRDESAISIWNIEEGRKIMEKACGLNCAIYTDGSSEYFSLQSSGAYHILWSRNNVYWNPLIIYKVDEEHRFTEYVNLSCAWASFDGSEIIWQKYFSNNIHYSKFHSFKELKQKAEKLLDGEVLTEEEKNLYFISE